MDLAITDNRDRGIFTGTITSKYLVRSCNETNTHPLSLEAEVLRNVAYDLYRRTCLLSTASYLHPEESRDKNQNPKSTVPGSLALYLNSLEDRNKITTL